MDSQQKILVNRSVDNDPKAVFDITAPFGSKVFAAVEACTGSAEFADALVRKFKWSVDLAHPGYTARMKQTPDKSDWTDAKLLADLTRVGYLPRVWLAPKYIRDLRDIIHHRYGLVEQRKQVKLRIRALLRNHRIINPHNPWTIAWKEWLFATRSQSVSPNVRWLFKQHFALLDYLTARIDDTEKRIRELVKDDDTVKTLLAQPGIGLVSAVTLRATIGQFDRFRNGKQLAHFCAVTPRNDSTAGKTTTGGLVKTGDPMLRIVLMEAAHRLIRYDKHWQEMAEQLKKRGKPTCVVVAAVANRWLRRLYYQMTVGENRPVHSGNTTQGFSRDEQESTIPANTTS
jgi:transposase